MDKKKKICAGFDGNSHEDYIYKNIDGKKYCKSCTFKLQPPKKIKPVSDKYRPLRIKIKQNQYQKDTQFYNKVWKDTFYKILSDGSEIMVQSPRCINCSKRLGEEPNLTFFHHILEKRNYPEYRYLDENIVILCTVCHNAYESFPDKVPKVKKMREELLEKLNRLIK